MHESICPESHDFLLAKNVGKKSSLKSAKNRFYIHTNIVTKKWEQKNARINFSRNTRFLRAKNVGKKSTVKSAKKRFLYSHEYRDLKMGGKKARSKFSRNTRIMRGKMLGKNRL